MKTLILLTALVLSPFALSACNTVEGFGQDVERAGESIQNL